MFKKIECPFDLESIFTLQFNTSGLKSVLEFILEHIGTLNEQTAEHYSAFLKT
jgi:phenylalanine-4-hydroxylase